MSELRKLDRVRHDRLLQQIGIVDSIPASIGLYYTKVQPDSPPREFYVKIDMGSNLLWVYCEPCIGCPRPTIPHTQIGFFYPSRSSTSSSVSYNDQRCTQTNQPSTCSTSNQCSYKLYYEDGYESSGVYIADLMHLDIIQGNATFTNSSTQILFGCCTLENKESSRGLDGQFGFGRGDLSVISQLLSQGLGAHVFSHCLQGSGNGGGRLVLGQILEPNIVYTPLVPSRPQYNVDLQGISINGQPLHIRKSIFSTSHNQIGTIIDSGTALAYLTPKAYQPLVDKVPRMVSPGTRSFGSNGDVCYEITSSLHDTFFHDPACEEHRMQANKPT